ncbi:hypothetical protein RQP46_010391 [Phenoliferia psychrophenolica]
MAQPNHYDLTGGGGNGGNGSQVPAFTGFPMGLSRPPMQAGLTQAQTQHLNIAGRGGAQGVPQQQQQQGGGQGGAAHLQAMILNMQNSQSAQAQQLQQAHFGGQLQPGTQMHLQQQQLLQMQQQHHAMQQQAQAQAAAAAAAAAGQQHQQPPPGPTNMAALAELLRTGAITADQFNVRSLLPSLCLFISVDSLSNNNSSSSNNKRSNNKRNNNKRNNKPPRRTNNNSSTPNNNSVRNNHASDRIPYAILQPHMQALHIMRNIQTKVVSLGNSLKTGVIGGGEGGVGGAPISMEQRGQIEKDLDTSRRQLQQTMSAVDTFSRQWGQPKILADWNHYSQNNAVQQQPSQQQQQQPQQGQQMPPLHLLQTQLDPQLFMKTLFEVMRRRGEPIQGAPMVDGREVDLYRLYQVVLLCGGFVTAQQKNAWPSIVKQLGWSDDTSDPSTVAHLAQQLAATYARLLYPFEEVWSKSLEKHDRRKSTVSTPTPSTSSASATPAASLPSTAAMATMSQGQLLSFGLNPSQIEFLRASSQPGQGPGPTVTPSPVQQPALPLPIAQPGQPRLPGQLQPTSLRPHTMDPNLEQISEARAIVQGMRAQTEIGRHKIKPLDTLSEEEKARVAALTHELIPVVKKVYEILPLFLAMSCDSQSVQKILTMTALFNDQLKYLQGGHFALNMTALEQLRDQFHRCWGFVKQNHKSARPSTTSSTSTAATEATTTTMAPGTIGKDQFSLMVSKNAALRQEDLKPPPSKHRRTASSAQSPSMAFSPSFSPSAALTPKTPQTDADSPPKSEATPHRSVSSRSAKGPAAASTSAAGAKGRGGAGATKKSSTMVKLEPKDAASLLSTGANANATTSNLQPEEEQLSLKRKRDQDEISLDPDAFIERTLRTLPLPLDSSFLARDLTSHLPFDYDPVVPSIQPPSASAKPLSFSVLSSASSPPPPPSLTRPPSQPTTTAPLTPAFDFSFFIDATAAGFDTADPPPSTPELSTTPFSPSKPSPPSDSEEETMNHALNNSSTLAPVFTPGEQLRPTTAGNDEYESSIQPPPQPSTFNFAAAHASRLAMPDVAPVPLMPVSFCFHTAKDSFVLPLWEAKKGLRMLKEAGMSKINFAGGEPFTKPRSNGSKVTDSWLNGFGEYVDIFGVSCDSFDEETNVKIGRSEGGYRGHIQDARRISEQVVNSLNWEEDMNSGVEVLNPHRWKVFQCLVLEGENSGSRTSIRDARELVVSDEQFLDCSKGGKTPGPSILAVGVTQALQKAGFNQDAFISRGGVYDWQKVSGRESELEIDCGDGRLKW